MLPTIELARMQMSGSHVALVVGSEGVIGKNLVRHLMQDGNWEVHGVSRRKSGSISTTIPADLADATSLDAYQEVMSRITHVYYTAYQHRQSWADLIAPNMTMLATVLGAIERHSPNVRHVSIMQGYKVYGAHLGPFRTPARESDPGFMPPEFMLDQQRLLESTSQVAPWSWSAIRPSVVTGPEIGSPMNLAMVIAAYAAISRELGLPLRFPGKPGAYHSLLELTDAGLLAHATVWAAQTPAAANQAFNIANGDLFRWSDLWPRIAEMFGMEVGAPLPMSLAEQMRDKEAIWEAMRTKYDLAPSWDDVASWEFADFVFGWDYDFFADGLRARLAGFHEYRRTDEMFARIFDQFLVDRVIPPRS